MPSIMTLFPSSGRAACGNRATLSTVRATTAVLKYSLKPVAISIRGSTCPVASLELKLRAKTSLGKQDPPYPTPAFRNALPPIRSSALNGIRTSIKSAKSASAAEEKRLESVIEMARKLFAKYLTMVELAVSVKRIVCSFFSIKGYHSSRISFSARLRSSRLMAA
ncbi:MAG: hypothetical protein BWY44_01003 [Candidatus Omnitrophica bacterium ADurb.Bin292]|nr:MAG: hypothetical protein BWY44_01003 [Candidatus Omnitrophica bacterium ADurb.Bin292]